MNLLILCPKNTITDVVTRSIVSDSFVKDSGGNVFISGWWIDADEIQDSNTHLNITVDQEVPLDKSCSISGIDDVQEFFSSRGFVSCNKEGLEFKDEQ